MTANPKAGELNHPKHRIWVRQHPCVISDENCFGPVCACHFDGPVPPEDQGGTGRKDHSKWTFPMCHGHHAKYHRGWRTFERRYGVDTHAAAERMAARSPHNDWSPKRDTGEG